VAAPTELTELARPDGLVVEDGEVVGLSLRDRDLDVLSRVIRQLGRLRSLDLERNHLRHLPAWLREPSEPRVFDVARTGSPRSRQASPA